MPKAQKNTFEEIREIIRDLALSQKQMQERMQEFQKAQAAREKAQAAREAAREKAQAAREKAQAEREVAREKARKTEEEARKKALKTEEEAREKARKIEEEARKKTRKQNEREMKKIREANDKAYEKARQELLKEQRIREKSLAKLERTLDKTNGNFNNKWGKFVENLVKGDLVNLLRERHIKVVRVQPRMVYPPFDNYRGGEFDLVAINGRELVVVEVKSTLEKADVDRFIKKLKIFKKAPIECCNKDIYGGVAYLEVIKKADEYADSEGLFVIKAPGGTSKVSTITNDKNFRPKAF